MQAALENPEGITQETLNLLVAKQKAKMRAECSSLFGSTATDYMQEKKQVALGIIKNLDPEAAQSAREYNENLRQQVLPNQKK